MPTAKKPPAKKVAPKKQAAAPARPKLKASQVKLPPNTKSLPAGAQALYRKGVVEGGIAGGWAAVKQVFEKDEATGKWRKKK